MVFCEVRPPRVLPSPCPDHLTTYCGQFSSFPVCRFASLPLLQCASLVSQACYPRPRPPQRPLYLSISLLSPLFAWMGQTGREWDPSHGRRNEDDLVWVYLLLTFTPLYMGKPKRFIYPFTCKWHITCTIWIWAGCKVSSQPYSVCLGKKKKS